MTELQKKIQKTSRFTANTFRLITLFPLGGILVTLVALGGLLIGNDTIVQQLIVEAPKASTLQIVLFLLCTIAVLGLAFYCLLQAQAIFRDISREPIIPYSRKEIPPITAPGMVLMRAVSLPIKEQQRESTAAPPITYTL